MNALRASSLSYSTGQAKDTKEESTKVFGFSFAGKTANEKAAFLKTVARFSKNTLLTVLNFVTFVSLWFINLLLWVAGMARVSANKIITIHT